MKIDRDLQLQILNVLADAYPVADRSVHSKVMALGEQEAIIANLLYLEGHGLLVAGVGSVISGRFTINASVLKITPKGLDFLADDGGLSAILGVVMIKLHDDTIRQLIEEKIIGSDLPPEEKKRFVDQLRELPGESLKHLTTKLIDLGISHAPDALTAIKTALTAYLS